MAIQNLSPLCIVNLAGPPSSPAAGWIYFDTSLGQFGIYSGAAWAYVTGAAGAASTPDYLFLRMALR